MKYVYECNIALINGKKWFTLVNALHNSEYGAVMIARSVIDKMRNYDFQFLKPIKRQHGELYTDRLINLLSDQIDFMINPSPESLKKLNVKLNGIMKIRIIKRLVNSEIGSF